MSFITNIPYRNQQNILKNFDANLARKGKILREMTSGSKVNSLRDRSTIFTKGPGSSMVGEVYEVENKARAQIATDVMNNFNKIFYISSSFIVYILEKPFSLVLISKSVTIILRIGKKVQ